MTDSDVMPVSYQIQDLLKPARSNSPLNFSRTHNPAKYIFIIDDFCLARQKHGV